jgi:hypothetical protein
MNSFLFPNTPSEFSAKVYGEEVKIIKPSSDLDMEELLSIFHRLALGCQFSEEVWRHAVMELADRYEEDAKIVQPPHKEDSFGL